MTATDVAAWIGALTGSGVLLWDVFKWIHSGARIRISAAPNMVGFGGAEKILGGQTCVAVEATNVGQSKTTITHAVGFHYKNRWDRLVRRKAETTFIVPDPSPGKLPHVLDIGERWLGMVEQNKELEEMSRNGYLLLGVYHSTGKRPALQRVVIHNKSDA